MPNKFNEATPLRPNGDRVMDSMLVNIDLPNFLQQIKQESSWNTSDRNAITVFKSNGLCIVLIALHKGAEMKPHTAAGMISLQVLEGKIEFKTAVQYAILTTGQMLALHDGIQHSISALDEATFLLTLALSRE